MPCWCQHKVSTHAQLHHNTILVLLSYTAGRPCMSTCYHSFPTVHKSQLPTPIYTTSIETASYTHMHQQAKYIQIYTQINRSFVCWWHKYHHIYILKSLNIICQKFSILFTRICTQNKLTESRAICSEWWEQSSHSLKDTLAQSSVFLLPFSVLVFHTHTLHISLYPLVSLIREKKIIFVHFHSHGSQFTGRGLLTYVRWAVSGWWCLASIHPWAVFGVDAWEAVCAVCPFILIIDYYFSGCSSFSLPACHRRGCDLCFVWKK